MANTSSPTGFAPKALTSWTKYYIPATDTNEYRVGDAVKSAGGSDATGVVAVTLHSGAGAARGVIVAVDPGLPATGGLSGGVKLSVPATKSSGYYVWVDDNPSSTFAIVDDGLTPAKSVAANVGSNANFTPGGAASLNGSNSSSASLLSASLGGITGCLRVVSLAPGAAYGAGATWLVKWNQHELAPESDLEVSSLSGVTYDGSSRVTAAVINGVAYTFVWGANSVIVTRNGFSRTISLDSSGRFITA